MDVQGKSSSVADKSVAKNKIGFKTLDIVYIAVCAALMAVCSWIQIPTVVPFTLQTFAVFFAVYFLGGKKGTLAVFIYILLGMVGLPVFAGFKGGFGALFGMTGGYIMGFILQAAVFWLFEVFFGRKLWSEMVSMVLGLVACYAFGTVWFMLVYSGKNGPISLMSALGMCVFPFVLIDVAKMLVAVTLGKTLRKAFHMQ